MYGSKDPTAAAKAQQEAVLMETEISALQADLAKLEGSSASPSSPSPAATPAAVPAPASSVQSQGGGGDRARVLYDFVAERPEELSLRAGDEVTVLDSSEAEGWWEGMDGDGRTGFFPGSYVEMIH